MASSRNWNRIERLVATTDFSMPISRVRCVTETSMMLARPTPPKAAPHRGNIFVGDFFAQHGFLSAPVQDAAGDRSHPNLKIYDG
jgi:hypothetical protein